MADWLNNLGTGLGNALIGVNNPFGLAPPEGFDRNAAMRQGALSLGMNVLANASENPAVALGRGYRQAQAIASDNQQNAMTAQAMLQEAEYKKQQREEEAKRKQQVEAQISQLPPELQGLARIAPEKVFGHLIDSKFPDPQGGNSDGAYGVPLPYALPDGSGIGYGLPTKGGHFVPLSAPNGASFLSPFQKAEQTAAGGAAGKERGGAAAALPGAQIDTQSINDKIDMIEQNPDLPNAIGYGNAIGDYFTSNGVLNIRSQLNELEGGAFMSAYSSLKGGGQITEVESAQAKQAMADMQTARKMSDPDLFKKALERFRGAVNRGYQKIQAQAGQFAPGDAAVPTGAGEQWEIGPDGKPRKVQ